MARQSRVPATTCGVRRALEAAGDEAFARPARRDADGVRARGVIAAGASPCGGGLSKDAAGTDLTRWRQSERARRRVSAHAKRGIDARYPWKEEPNPYFELRTSEIQGTGAFAIRTIRKGTRITEYLGQRVSWRTADKRYDDENMSRHHTFLFTVDDKTCIDAAVKGNDARFLNHSCEGNCEAITDRKRIFIEARR